MNWVLILLVFNATTGELVTHSETRYETSKACEEAGIKHTTDVAFEQPGMKMSYVCLSPDTFLDPPKPPKEEKKRKGFGIF